MVSTVHYPRGGIVVDRDLEKDITELFSLILKNKLPVASAIAVADPRFGWNDERSMAANNTSGFNYRPMTGGGKLSAHALGRAIDINPLFNPYIKSGVVLPAGATYNVVRPGDHRRGLLHCRIFKRARVVWGGDWTSLKDYQHFEKVP